ncbi:MAG: flagellar export chaperone FlgN [Acidimicrobiia bacterium]
MDELADWLAHECRLLEMLLFKLVEEQLLLAAGESRFLGVAAAEVQRALGRLGEAQLRRAMMVDALAREPHGATLKVLAAESREPYGTIFEDHRRALLDLMSEIDEVSGQSRRLAEIGAKLAGLEQAADDELELALAGAGYQVALSAQLSMPALRDFLG